MPLPKKPLDFFIEAKSQEARAGKLFTRFGPVLTPVFMPVGTQGVIKSLVAKDVEKLGARLILANTYHLYLRPGAELLKQLGGLHKFCGFDASLGALKADLGSLNTEPDLGSLNAEPDVSSLNTNLNASNPSQKPLSPAFLTDSGGFQAFSLSKNVKLTDAGIEFKSHIDGSKHLFTPESVLNAQYAFNSDICMLLDDLIALPATQKRLDESLNRTLLWAKKSLEHHERAQNKENSLFAIVQGGTNAAARAFCAQELQAMDAQNLFKGYAIGGLAVGESSSEMLDTIEATNAHLPSSKPRYLMGVGTPVDLIEGVARGIDMFDCVYPTRNARNGMIFTRLGHYSIKNARFRTDSLPLEENCACPTCQMHSRAYLQHLFKARELSFARLASLHNLHFYLELMRDIRAAILRDDFASFRKDFLASYLGA